MLLIAVCTCAYRCGTLSLTILVSTYGFHTMSHAGSLEKRLPHMYATKKSYDFFKLRDLIYWNSLKCYDYSRTAIFILSVLSSETSN